MKKLLRVSNIRLAPGKEGRICEGVFEKLGTKSFSDMEIVKKSLDARKKNDIKYIYSVDVSADEKYACRRDVSIAEKNIYVFPGVSKKISVIIVGSGPAGLFCALELAKAGIKPIVVERGGSVEERRKQIDEFWKCGRLSQNSNVQFGEGGAGTFSDGKLTTGIKDPRINEVLSEFIRFGAPAEIKYLAHPHIGTDKLQKIVKAMREEIISLGGEFHFNTSCTGLLMNENKVCGALIKKEDVEKELYADCVVTAAGHSARDTFEMLLENGVFMEQKQFSVGMRIEHRQSMINLSQYGKSKYPLPPAEYKLSAHLQNGRGVYTFCMCPGGYVINASSETGRVVTNGMSNFARDADNANSAVLVDVFPSDYDCGSVLDGIAFQRKIEERAFISGGGDYSMPITTAGDFISGKYGCNLGSVTPTAAPKAVFADFEEIFPGFVTSSVREALLIFNKKLNGFAAADSVLTAPETRSSSPVRIQRDRITHMTNVNGLFSAGEGGGHAGGITSSAVDGIKTAESIAKIYG